MRADQAKFRAERRDLEGFGEVWYIGGDEEVVLEELAASNADLRRRELAGVGYCTVTGNSGWTVVRERGSG